MGGTQPKDSKNLAGEQGLMGMQSEIHSIGIEPELNHQDHRINTRKSLHQPHELAIERVCI